ncbi:hypothetical protein [Endozoicomonas acroporae]|uniref:hypothetical protein n=1 Tax=Endozoicomonas acroporae TaxID=1701104 RepID=UPI003D7ADC47
MQIEIKEVNRTKTDNPNYFICHFYQSIITVDSNEYELIFHCIHKDSTSDVEYAVDPDSTFHQLVQREIKDYDKYCSTVIDVCQESVSMAVGNSIADLFSGLQI